MDWVEDSVVFRGAIRRSGNSLVITIPAELSQRLLLREGQDFIIYGIGRRRPDFEGGLQVYLGYFIVNEKVPVMRFKIDINGGSLEKLIPLIREIRDTYSLSDIRYRQLDSKTIEVELFFGAISEKGITRLKTREEIEDAASSIEFKLRLEGFKILEKELVDKIIEWRSIDPSIISRAPYKITEIVRWRWEI
ncbi:MAG: hypothetical protein ABDH32_00555 [Candidatus Caldarchaeales archaeon]